MLRKKAKELFRTKKAAFFYSGRYYTYKPILKSGKLGKSKPVKSIDVLNIALRK